MKNKNRTKKSTNSDETLDDFSSFLDVVFLQYPLSEHTLYEVIVKLNHSDHIGRRRVLRGIVSVRGEVTVRGERTINVVIIIL